MELWKKRDNIEKKIESSFTEKNSEYYFSSYYLSYIENKDSGYYKNLEIFKLLFKQGDEARIYLWNKMWPFFNDEIKIDENDYTKEAIDFIYSINNFYHNQCEKYGDNYSSNQNINTEFETKRLLLKTFNNELNSDYIDFFQKNKDECETFYGKEFSDNEQISRFVDQSKRQLSFALIKKETNEFVGSAALELLRTDCVYNIEYFIKPQYRNNGYALEAVSKIIELAKKRQLLILEETIREGVYNVVAANVRCIEARIDVNNYASACIVKKTGFEKMGKLLFFDKYKDTYIDAEIYDLVL